MKNKKKTSGFTLIELLVVVSIIALLLGILMPALTKAKIQAQSIICGTNLKNYGSALYAYSMDNKDKAPFMVSWLYSQKTIQAGVDSGNVPKACRWHDDTDRPDGSLWPYLADKNVHLCPTFKTFAIRSGLDGCPNKSAHSRRTRFAVNYSYSMNWHLGFDWTMLETAKNEGMFGREISMKLSKVKRAKECLAFSEENLWAISAADWESVTGQRGKKYSSNYLNDNALWTFAIKNRPAEATDNVATYHKTPYSRRNAGNASVVFVDGHVESIQGRPGREAYETYGIPYIGHDSINIW